MKALNYYHDGYTELGYVAAVPRLHGALRFSYRPALVEERSRLADAASRLKSQLYDRYLAAFVADRLVSWDVQDANGNAVPTTGASLLRLQPELFLKLHRIVLGSHASDLNPQWPSEAEDRLFEIATTAAISGQSIGEVREEHDEKN